MTWDDIATIAKTEVGIAVPKELITPRTLLTWASRAQALLQSYSRCVTRTSSITLDIASTDGSYAMPAEQKFQTIRFLDYRPTGTTPITPVTGFRIPIMSWDKFYALQNSGLLNPQSSAYSYLSPSGQDSWIVAGVNQQKIYFNPINGFTGTVNVTYNPRLTEYSPSASGDWTGYTSDPGAAMKLYGPEPEMEAGIPGIISYVKAQILRAHPRFEREYMEQFKLLIAEFEQAKYLVAKEETDYTHYEAAPTIDVVF